VRPADDADVEPGADGERGAGVLLQAHLLDGHDGSRPDDQPALADRVGDDAQRLDIRRGLHGHLDGGDTPWPGSLN
jgi:hypothetical protein